MAAACRIWHSRELSPTRQPVRENQARCSESGRSTGPQQKICKVLWARRPASPRFMKKVGTDEVVDDIVALVLQTAVGGGHPHQHAALGAHAQHRLAGRVGTDGLQRGRGQGQEPASQPRSQVSGQRSDDAFRLVAVAHAEQSATRPRNESGSVARWCWHTSTIPRSQLVTRFLLPSAVALFTSCTWGSHTLLPS